MLYVKHESLENDFSRKSKRYRTKYFDSLGMLFAKAIDDEIVKHSAKTHTINQDERSQETLPRASLK
jgi:hypothetical protein